MIDKNGEEYQRCPRCPLGKVYIYQRMRKTATEPLKTLYEFTECDSCRNVNAYIKDKWDAQRYTPQENL